MRPNPPAHPGFQRIGGCTRCGWYGGLDDGLCILCQADPALTDEPVTVPAHVAFELAKQCLVCGKDHHGGDLCPRCMEDAA